MARPRGRKNVRYLFLCHGAPHVTIFRRPGVERDKPPLGIEDRVHIMVDIRGPSVIGR